MARCFVTRRLPGQGLERLAERHEVEVWAEPLPPSEAALRERAGNLDGLLTLLTDPITADLIAAAPRLRAISNYAVGTDNIDLAAATARGIPVGNTPDVLTDATADLTLALLLGVARRLVEGDAYVRRGDWRTWEPDLLIGAGVHAATVGIVGAGRIGRAVARRLEGFDCTILQNARSGGVPLDELLERSDYVSLHAPLTTETRGLIGEAALSLMKPTAYLINTARGPLVDTGALVRALRDGRLAGAALDVTDPEPLPVDHPLLEAPNLLVLPHLGSATRRTRETMVAMAVDNLLAGLAGERMPHCANPEVYG